MSAREEILQRIRTATADVAEKDPILDVPVEWTYGQALQTPDVLADFVEKVEDYKARVVRVAEGDIGSAIVEALAGLQAGSAVLPGGLPEAWVQAVTDAGVEVFRDDPELSHGELNLISAVVTTAAVGMADSGTIALDHGPGQGRRALSLLPDCHVCVVRADQVVSDVPEGIARLAPALRARRPVTWLSGGSATSDIELSRVEGVHGPRHLWVILVD
ncbi:LutC/YkgG family protein [Propioniciclava flava]|uniref:Lactate utilization protein C n=1 Tax=Propioniciclava flava TaxID=2072026 RepID=A0A4Q2EIV4_9ACTN|nr:LUD domain-containing protein [Propioniciclava flava]RXW33073.1 lactate utilization protein C [Propioniciclava flava]